MVVGVASNDLGDEAFLWTDQEGMVELGFSAEGGYFSGAEAITPDGNLVVGVDGLGSWSNAVHWTAIGQMTPLGNGGGFASSQAVDVSAAGDVVVGFGLTEGTKREAFIWTSDDGMRRLEEVLAELNVNTTGWQLREATAISDNGRVVVGRGVNPAGQAEAWVVDFDAVPGDVNGDRRVDRADVRILAVHFGRQIGAVRRAADLDGDGAVTLLDAEIIKSHFGLGVTDSIPGDINHDQRVDRLDVVALASDFGNQGAGGPRPGDVNGDGFVTLDDAYLLKTQFGASTSVAAVSGSTAVSEPSTGLLSLVGTICTIVLCRRRRKD
jgi:hypothetical protein